MQLTKGRKRHFPKKAFIIGIPTAENEPNLTLSEKERPIGSLGIHMVKKLSSSMSYKRTDNKNILTLGIEPDKKRAQKNITPLATDRKVL